MSSASSVTRPVYGTTGTAPEMDRAQVLAMASSLYRAGSAVRRKMQHLRPYICPFDILVPLVPDNASLFDIGCGSGLFLGLAVLSRKNVTGTGVDLSEGALAMAWEMRNGLAAEQAERLSFQCCHGTDDWPARTFDVVSLIDVMHHIPRPRRKSFFDAVIARVKPGGILLYKDMRHRPRWKAFLNRCHDLVVAHDWIHYCPIAEIECAARQSGLVELRAETIDRLWYAHVLRVYRRPGL